MGKFYFRDVAKIAAGPYENSGENCQQAEENGDGGCEIRQVKVFVPGASGGGTHQAREDYLAGAGAGAAGG